jgi:anaerobic ribonucleoside-triphosphate reductase
VDGEFTKSDLTKQHIVSKSSGRELKAVLDICEKIGYFTKRKDIAKGGHVVYRRTNKMDGLEDLRKNEPKVHTYPSIPSQ